MPKAKQESNVPVAWKLSELEKKFLTLEEEVGAMRREAKARERRISDLEIRNTRLEDCVQQVGKNIPAPLHYLHCSPHCIHSNQVNGAASKLPGRKLSSFSEGTSPGDPGLLPQPRGASDGGGEEM